jgi:intraflagellar transport protein 122
LLASESLNKTGNTLHSRRLQNKQFEVARKAFIRLKDPKFIDLVTVAEKESKAGAQILSIQAEILAYQGNYKELPMC